MKPFHYFTALLISWSLLGCKPKETTLSGQVFVVTRGAENIKLGLVEVKLIEKQSVVKFLKERQDAIDSEIKSRKDEYAMAETNFAKARVDFDAFNATNDYSISEARYEIVSNQIAAYDEENYAQVAQDKANENAFDEAKQAAATAPQDEREFYRAIASQKGQAMVDFLRARDKWREANSSAIEEESQEKTQLLEKLNKSKPLADKFAANLDAAKQQLDSSAAKVEESSHPTFETYFKSFLPTVIQTVNTDADGKFSLSYPRRKSFAILAEAERMVGDSKERYSWLVDAPSGVEAAQIFLSNNDLAAIDPDAYFKIKPKSELQESSP